MVISLVPFSPSQRLIEAGSHHNAPVGARIAEGKLEVSSRPADGVKLRMNSWRIPYPSRFLPEPMPLVALSS